MPSTEIMVSMDEADFGFLCKSSSARHPGMLGPGRFEAPPGCEVNAGWDWRRVYWFGEDYAALVLARAYIAVRGFGFEVLRDTSGPHGEPPRGWCILSDYDSR